MNKQHQIPAGEGLPRAHILRGRSAVMQLFGNGNSFAVPPVRVVYRWHDEQADVPVQVMFTISKRSFRKASHRNRIRRLMREAWRRHSNRVWELAQKRQKNLHVALIYSRQDMPAYAALESKIIQAIHRLTRSDEASD
ncbi:MAG: ribonuclease P protein component [Bacteroidetes bacterium]|nr:ribonuclease P protein component [Bacteroidota bacterium]